MFEYPKIKERFPEAHKVLLDLSFETGITEIRSLTLHFFYQFGLKDSFSLIADLSRIEKGIYQEMLGKSSLVKWKCMIGDQTKGKTVCCLLCVDCDGSYSKWLKSKAATQ